MAQLVKRPDGRRPRASAGQPRSRISPKRQVTIPAAVSRAAGFAEGDVVVWSVDGRGQVRLTRVDELLDRYSGAIKGSPLSTTLDELRRDW